MIAYTFKIKTTPKLIEKFEDSLNITRLIYNLAKEVKIESYKKGLKLSKFDLMKQLPELKKEFAFVQNAYSQSLQMVIIQLDDAFNSFYRGAGYPKWASKKYWRSFSYPGQSVRVLKNNRIKIPKIGSITFFKSRGVIGLIKTVRIIKKADGWYLNIITDHQIQKCDNQAEVGIDRGIAYLAVTSDGQYFENIRTTKKYEAKLRIEQRSLARKKKGSTNWRKQVERIQKLYLKISRVKDDYLHKVSRDIANNYQTIYIEDLNVNGMIKNKNLSKAIADVSWGKLGEYLTYKSNVIKVNPAYTSQDCINCGNRDKDNRKTQISFKCTLCGFEINADENASLNILKRGQTLLSLNVGQ